jgi:hypothetical protein
MYSNHARGGAETLRQMYVTCCWDPTIIEWQWINDGVQACRSRVGSSTSFATSICMSPSEFSSADLVWFVLVRYLVKRVADPAEANWPGLLACVDPCNDITAGTLIVL